MSGGRGGTRARDGELAVGVVIKESTTKVANYIIFSVDIFSAARPRSLFAS